MKPPYLKTTPSLYWSGLSDRDFRPGAHLTIGFSIIFEIWSKFGMFEFTTCVTNHNDMLHTLRQCKCRDVCRISLWSVEYISNQNAANFGRNFKFDRNIVSGTGANCIHLWTIFRQWTWSAIHGNPCHCLIWNANPQFGNVCVIFF